ncbi:hypothetical protein HY993_03020 [Candidatus Micrarchaeota archaeon]|nr:hypothetical protein [Candidatus Micrarchaeota archaeon]
MVQVKLRKFLEANKVTFSSHQQDHKLVFTAPSQIPLERIITAAKKRGVRVVHPFFADREISAPQNVDISFVIAIQKAGLATKGGKENFLSLQIEEK